MRLSRFVIAVVLFAATLTIAACPKPDTSNDFAILLDGRTHDIALGPAVGEIAEGEAGVARTASYSILFPAGRPALGGGVRVVVQRPVKAGEEITFGAKQGTSPVRVRYVSPSGLAEYSTGLLDGSGVIRFDGIDLRPGGRVSGRLVRAVLFGGGPAATPERASRMELYNFPFDTTFKAGP